MQVEMSGSRVIGITREKHKYFSKTKVGAEGFIFSVPVVLM
jgi:hypothetical protein